MSGQRRKIWLPTAQNSMKTSQLSSTRNGHAGDDLDDRPKFGVVIIYEDGAAGRRAKHFYDKVIWELVDECEFDLELWSFRVLALPGIGNWAARSAAQADLVILSMHGKTALSSPTRKWIGRWRRGLVDCKPALVVLLDETEAKGGGSAATLGYLRNLAVQNGISFYTHVFKD